MFTILVVEDNADMRELFCTVLSDSGYRSIPVFRGQCFGRRHDRAFCRQADHPSHPEYQRGVRSAFQGKFFRSGIR